MAQRRCLQALALAHRAIPLLSSPPPPLPLNPIPLGPTFSRLTPNHLAVFSPRSYLGAHFSRYLSSAPRGGDSDDDDEEEEHSEGEEGECEYEEGAAVASVPSKAYTAEEKEAEAAAIGYRVVGPLQPDDRVFKRYEPVFAVVQIGSHQFKVSNGDSIFTERLKFCDVNDKITLNKVLLLGSSTQTIIGRPTVPDAVVHAVVEEHALDAKVIIFKKKRRKNYRRTKGHRQELTQLRITDIQGIEKPKKVARTRPKKTAPVEKEEVAVAA